MYQCKRGPRGQRKVKGVLSSKLSALILEFFVLLKMVVTCGYLAFWVYIGIIKDQGF